MTIQSPVLAEIKRERLIADPGMNHWCGIQDCRQPQLNSLPLCEEHAWDVWREMDMKADTLRERAAANMRRAKWEDERFDKMLAVRDAKAKGTYRSDPGLIYYLEVGDQIKIGFTTNLQTRLSAYPPNAKLLATHPGTLALERQMHDKFAAHLAGRKEWFTAHDEIHEHISNVRRMYKQAA